MLDSKKKIFFILVTILNVSITFGQFIPPPPPPPPPGLPIDGGLLFLAVIGVIYGVKKLRK